MRKNMKVKVFSLLLGVATFAIGIIFVAALQIFVSLFDVPLATARSGQDERPGSFLRSNSPFPELPSNRALSCYDPAILPIWSELKRDEQFMSMIDHVNGVLDCSDMLEIKRVDLNRDKVEEFIVTGKAIYFCGARGNCAFWVFEIKKSRVKRLLDSGGIRLEIEKSVHNGSRDLLVRFNGGNILARYSSVDSTDLSTGSLGATSRIIRLWRSGEKAAKAGRNSFKLVIRR